MHKAAQALLLVFVFDKECKADEGAADDAGEGISKQD